MTFTKERGTTIQTSVLGKLDLVKGPQHFARTKFKGNTMLNNSLFLFITISVIFTFTGCTTIGPLNYGKSNNGEAGYFEHQRNVYKWMFGSYYDRKQTPQQAANIVMRRAAETASQSGFTWVRLLNYDAEKRSGPIGSLPASIDLKNGSIFRGMDFYGNQDERINDRQFGLGVDSALVEYVEFSRNVDCHIEKCGTMDFFIEKCSDGWDGGKEELSSMCSKIAASKKGSNPESCIDHARFISKDFCSTINRAAYDVRGMIEERKLGGVGDWFRTEDILQKYTIRSEKWANAQRKR